MGKGPCALFLLRLRPLRHPAPSRKAHWRLEQPRLKDSHVLHALLARRTGLLFSQRRTVTSREVVPRACFTSEQSRVRILAPLLTPAGPLLLAAHLVFLGSPRPTVFPRYPLLGAATDLEPLDPQSAPRAGSNLFALPKNAQRSTHSIRMHHVSL